jgi:hypothetical protein
LRLHENEMHKQSDLDTTRLYTTRTSVIRGFFLESWYPQLVRVFEPNCTL